MEAYDLIPAGPLQYSGSATDRLERIARELRYAWAHTDAARLRGFGTDVTFDLGRSVRRRAVKVGELVVSVSRGVHSESVGAIHATRDGRFAAHVADRKAAAADTARRWSGRARTSVTAIRRAFDAHPSESAVHLLVFTVAALAGSGGLDGHGGAPDLTHGGGLLTHSILMGAALETLCLATVRLIDVVHAGLPEGRDPWWDAVQSRSALFARTASQGLSVGVAYHLLIDGLIDPHEIPAAASSEAWAAWLLVNAKVEAFDVINKPAAPEPSTRPFRSASPA